MELTYYRDGKLARVDIEIGDFDARKVIGEDTLPQLAGASFSDIPKDHAAHGNVEGVLIKELEPGSPAWRFGLRQGDILLAVNRERIKTLDELRLLAESTVRVVAVNVLRGNSQLFLVIG